MLKAECLKGGDKCPTCRAEGPERPQRRKHIAFSSVREGCGQRQDNLALKFRSQGSLDKKGKSLGEKGDVPKDRVGRESTWAMPKSSQ